jgi:hypothetical protein
MTPIKHNPLATVTITIQAYGQTETITSSMPAGQIGWHRKLRSMMLDPEREIGSLVHAGIDSCENKAMKAENREKVA